VASRPGSDPIEPLAGLGAAGPNLAPRSGPPAAGGDHGPTEFKAWRQALAKTGCQFYVNPFLHGHVETEIMSAALAKSRDDVKQQV
jgi:hypothetical protein